MITLENFPAHLETIEKKDWQKLLDLIPGIEEAEEFGTIEGGDEIRPGVFHIPYSVPSPLVSRFEQLAYEMGIVIQFQWMEWDEGRKLASVDNPDIDKIDLITCCKLITAILRNNRFCDGALVDFFESGLALRILKRMESLIN